VVAGPVIADCANNIASALDHIAAAIAKARDHPRLDRLYFPWGLKDEDFEKRLGAAEAILGPAMTKAIAAARREHWHEVAHVHAAKQISRDGKHWELRATMGSAHAVQLVTQNFETHLFQVPGSAFDESDFYAFHRSAEKLPSARAWELLIKLTIDGLDEGLATTPSSIFPCAFRFV
jgi:hypothetical protein